MRLCSACFSPLNLVQTFALSFADGLFGQCRGSKHGVVQYQVTVPVLKRMQEVLKQLMLQGLSWQDDITQYILSKELKRVPHSTLSLKPNSSSPSSQLSQYVLFNGLLQRISRVLQKYRIDPRDLSQEQLYKLALILQLLQAQDKPGTVFIKRYQKTEKDVVIYPLDIYDGVKLLKLLANKIHLTMSRFINISVVGPALTFRIRVNEHNMTAADVAAKAVSEKNFLESETGLKIVQTGVGEVKSIFQSVLVLAMAVACFRHYAQQVANGKLGLGPEGGAETHFDYQELCRQHMASKSSLCRQECVGAVSSGMAGVSSQFSDGPQHSPSSTHSSTPSWSEEPAQSNMDISTGHMILTYMEDHLRNKDRLQKEWEALCSYQAEPSSVAVAQLPNNVEKNRHAESLPYDHSRVKLKADVNPNKQDYVNASIIFDHDPRQPSYIATQGPLPHTVTDFWQMVWENGCTVIVMMSALVEDGEKQCERYWPDEGSSLYHIYEVNLVSEHIWCKDFLVRSFYLKNVQTQETRTVTQFHLLSWPAHGIPTSTRPLLDFRRKVNKCYRGRSCPIIVHCSDGTGRTGTYILIDMVLNRMAKGVKEIDIAATLEHIRDQRPSLVRTKDQFEFALTAVAEEVNAILKALPQ
uniref:Receptor-type tyrosine-protein phosphatase-like N n=1 Tax=Gouania willdenowi TaxID=441366 RepID=A0A8C5HUQ3_GOUWI